MKKIIFASLAASLLAQLSLAQVYQWSYSYGSTAIDSQHDSHLSADGDFLVTGMYAVTMDFGDTSITYEGGNVDAYLGKISADGEPQWIRSFGGNADNAALQVVENSVGEILIMGYFQGAGPLAFDADPGEGEYLLEQTSPFLSRDCFILKLDSDGLLLWAKQISNPTGAAAEDGAALMVDDEDNVYIGGRYQYADFDPSDEGEDIRFSNDDGQDFNPFLVKLDTEGNYIWAKTLASTGHGEVSSIDFDEDGNIYLGGYFRESIDLDPSEDNEVIYQSAGGRDIYVVKLDPEGNYISGFTMGSSGLEGLSDILVVGDSYYICGGINLTVDIDPGDDVFELTTVEGVDGMLAKYSLDHELEYGFLVGGESDTSIEEMHELRIDGEGNITVSGNFYGTTDMNPGNEEVWEEAQGIADHYLLKIDPDGEYIGHAVVFGNDAQTSTTHEVHADGSYTLMGNYRGSVDLDPSSEAIIATSNGQYDMYLTRFTFDEANSVSNLSFAEGLVTIFPNPAQESFTVEAPFELFELRMFNIAGKQVLSQNNPMVQKINIAHLPKGVYIVQIADKNGETYTGKLIH